MDYRFLISVPTRVRKRCIQRVIRACWSITSSGVAGSSFLASERFSSKPSTMSSKSSGRPEKACLYRESSKTV